MRHYRYDCQEHSYLSDHLPCPHCAGRDTLMENANALSTGMGEKVYYMGASSLGKRDSLRTTLDAAIKDCSDFLASNPSCKERYIVKVVKVVKRNPPPVLVEDV